MGRQGKRRRGCDSQMSGSGRPCQVQLAELKILATVEVRVVGTVTALTRSDCLILAARSPPVLLFRFRTLLYSCVSFNFPSPMSESKSEYKSAGSSNKPDIAIGIDLGTTYSCVGVMRASKVSQHALAGSTVDTMAPLTWMVSLCVSIAFCRWRSLRM
jgi:hypothetical protein